MDDAPNVRGAVAFGRMVSHQPLSAVDALAEAWASIDGKLKEYRAGRNASSRADDPGGHFSGYQAEAEEMIRRLEARGFTVVPTDITSAIDRHAALVIGSGYRAQDRR
ncbi:hypothetical protein [Methylorubrum populi]|nr:hypothetical protein [Methylorubrum populi]